MTPRHRLANRLGRALTHLQVTPWRIYHLNGGARWTPAEVTQAKRAAKKLARDARRLADGLDALLGMVR